MANLILRQTGSITSPGASFKDAPLTNFEVDNNFSNLNIAVGFIEDLDTTANANIVIAINEIFSDLGNVDSLSTLTTTNVVAAINSVFNSPLLTGNITSNLIPSANLTFDIGSNEFRWNDIYLSGSTIFLGNGEIKIENDEVKFSVGGEEVLTVNNTGESSANVLSANVIITPAGSNTAPTFTTSGDTNTGIFFPAADTVAITTAGVEGVRVNSTGQVVVGTGSNTNPSITTTGDTNTGIFFPAADTIAFVEGGDEAARVNSSGQFVFGSGSNTNPAISFTGDTSTGFFKPSAGNVALSVNNIEALRVDHLRNVGIGTTSPNANYKLTVTSATNTARLLQVQTANQASGSSFVTGGIDLHDRLRDATTSTPAAFMRFENVNTNAGFPTTIRGIDITFGTANGSDGASTPATERMRIDASGKIIVGPFGGNGNAVVAGSSSPSFTNQPGTNLLLKSGDGSGTGFSFMSFSTSPAGSSGTTVNTAVEHMRIKSNGNVGIGTTDPATKLEISGSGVVSLISGTSTLANYLQVRNTGTANSLHIGLDNSIGSIFNTGTAYAPFIWTQASSIHIVTDSGSNILRYISGDLGLGIVPATKLDVAGTAKAVNFLLDAEIAGNYDIKMVRVSGDSGTNTVQTYWNGAFGAGAAGGCLGAYNRSGTYVSPGTVIGTGGGGSGIDSQHYTIYGFIGVAP